MIPSHPTPYRLALIGAGAIAADHCAAIARMPDLTLARVVDRHPERARRLAAAYAPEADTTTDPAALWGADVDAVVICTSPDSHVDLAVAAMERGKRVLLEKPAAVDLPSLDRLLAALERTGGQLLVGQTARFQPANLELSRIVAEGDIGRPRLIHISWYAGHVWPGGWRGWQLDVSRSGGHLLHNGVHPLDLACSLIDADPRRVCARGVPTWAPDMPTPDSFHLIVEFADGAQAVIEVSYALHRRGELMRRALVVGTAGTASVSTDDEPGGQIHPEPAPAGVQDAMYLQYSHFRDVLAGTAQPATTPRQIRATLAAAVAAEASAAAGGSVEQVTTGKDAA